MSYMKIGNTHIRENGHKINVFKKVDEIKQELKVVIPEIEGNKLLELMGHCRAHYEGKFYYGRRTSLHKRKREMTQNERIVYDYIIRKGLKPSTVYRWFLATRIPDDVREKLARGQVSYKAAMRIAWNRKRAAETNQGLLLIEELSPILSWDVGARVTFAFDKDFFNKCKEFTNKVVDVVFFIIIKEYNNIINELKKDNKLLTSLKELKCELTINCLNDL